MRFPLILFILLFWAFSFPSFAMEEDQELLFLEIANIATGYPQPKFEAPSSVTVITSDELLNMGARTLLDGLRMVPGLEIGLDISGMPIVSLRGLYSPGSEKVLFMINGRPVNNVLIGSGTTFFADLSVNKIERVEIIRGPGSVLYGSNAFCGVINIILKQENPEAISYRRGSYDVDEFAFQADRALGNLFAWINLNYREDNGANIKVKKDLFDTAPLLQINANLPRYDKSNEWVRRGEYYGGIKWRSFLFETLYIHHADGGYYNLSGVPSDKTRFARENFYTHFSYEGNIFKNLKAKIDLDTNYYHHHHYVDFFPPGTILINPARKEIYSFPYGMKWLREAEIFSWGMEGRFSYIYENHHVIGGAIFHNDDMHNVKLKENIKPTFPCPKDHWCFENTNYLVNIKITNWLENADRFYYSLYLQDQWQVNDKISFTAGIRRDFYDDFGYSTNVRAGLVINPFKNWYIKFLYGEAFRAPSFRELYLLPCPITPRRGNSSLEDERMESYEITLSYVQNNFQTLLTFFHHNYYDLIYLRPYKLGINIYDNYKDTVDINGIELENKFVWGAGNLNYIILNYSYREADLPKNSFIFPAYHTLGLNFHYHITPKLSINYKGNYISKRYHYSKEGYFLSDLVLNLYSPKYTLILGIYNMFDKHYWVPAYNKMQYPDGFERPGRTFEAKFIFYF